MLSFAVKKPGKMTQILELSVASLRSGHWSFVTELLYECMIAWLLGVMRYRGNYWHYQLLKNENSYMI